MGKRLWVERNKDGSWDAFSDDGAHIKFGKDRGQFTPGDLMKVALAGCAALSSQFAIEHTLGEGKGAKIVVDGTYDPENDAYTGFEEHVVIDAPTPVCPRRMPTSSRSASPAISTRVARSSTPTCRRPRCA